MTIVDCLVSCGWPTPQIALIIELGVACSAIGVIEAGLAPAGSLRHRPVASLVPLDVARDADGGRRVHDFFDVIGLVKSCTSVSILGIHIIVVGHESVYLSLILHVIAALLIVVRIGVGGVLNAVDVAWLIVSILPLWIVGISCSVIRLARTADVADCADLASADDARRLCVLTWKKTYIL